MRIRGLLPGMLFVAFIGRAIAFEEKKVFHLESDPVGGRISKMGWDTEGSGREAINLLRTNSGIGLRIKFDGQWRTGESFGTTVRIGDKVRRFLKLPPHPNPLPLGGGEGAGVRPDDVQYH